MQPSLGKWEHEQQFLALPDVYIQYLIIPLRSKIHILPSANSYCAFFKHCYYSFWECLYFLSIGLLWVLGSWLWEWGQRLKNPLRWALSFSYLSVHCPYWLHYGIAFRNYNFLYCSFCNCFLKKQQLCHILVIRIYSKSLSTIWDP